MVDLGGEFELNVVSSNEVNSSPPLDSVSLKKKIKGGWRAKRREILRQRGHVDAYGRRMKRRPAIRSWRTTGEASNREFDGGDETMGENGGKKEKDLVGSKREIASDEVKGSQERRKKKRLIESRKAAGDGDAENDQSDFNKIAHLNSKAEAATMEVLRGNMERIEGGASNKKEDEKARKEPEHGERQNIFGKSSFVDLGLDQVVAKHLRERIGVLSPTYVQEAVLRAVLERNAENDVLVQSATGTGKTLAFVLPVVNYLLNRDNRISRDNGSLAIILAPTRELAEQVEDVATHMLKPWYWIVVGSVRGGENKHKEKARLRKGINVLVATPGRLLDHIRNTRSFIYSHCEFLVLDEADKLLDLGFEADVKEIITSLNDAANLQGKRQRRCNILLSATLGPDVKRLADYSLKNPEMVIVENDTSGAKDRNGTSKFAMPHQLNQHCCIVEQKHRLVTLAAFLRLRALKGVHSGNLPHPVCKIMVFFSSCDSVDFHHALFQAAELPHELSSRTNDEPAEVPGPEKTADPLLPLSVYKIHGNRDQKDRIESLRNFRRSRRAVLFCTDVAARGLDLRGVEFAIQYDPPTGGAGENLEYLHRAGRTARLGERGDALLFLLPSEKEYKRQLELSGAKITEISGEAALAALQPNFQIERVSFAARLSTSSLQRMFESRISNSTTLNELAKAGYQAYCRAYATHCRDSKHIFHVRNLHLGHVGRAFGLSQRPKSFARGHSAKKENHSLDKEKGKYSKSGYDKGDTYLAIAAGSQRPSNYDQTTLRRRRREGGKNTDAYRELAEEFAS